ncbi:hypothetical protein KIN20_031845 [Parelaphostrongylus tenuis]|uniref:Uncharacterized protein n=1 Tax=Parelaphostrongylus tenuis TaxID=148309 RepID=A0AAD5WHJ8_PARTN|nr:hypothetical protein KIN20_031845 [Parelaphostrongylus tenuis]
MRHDVTKTCNTGLETFLPLKSEHLNLHRQRLHLSVAVVYTGDSTISTQLFGIAANKRGAQVLVNRPVMQVVLDALERQANGTNSEPGV